MNLRKLEKLTPFGTVIAAAGCPVCFPALAGLGSVLGIGLFARYESQFLILVQVFVALSMFLAYVSFKRTKNKTSLGISLISGLVMFFTWYVAYSVVVFYAGMAGLIISAVWNFILERKLPNCSDGVCASDEKPTDANKANLTCPHCSQVQEVEIPQTGCLAFHKCEQCEKLISVPKESKNCCVICEYADKKCPVAE